MATHSLTQPIYARSLIGRCPQPIGGPESNSWFVEDASETYKAGTLVYRDSSGALAICTVDGTPNSNGQILGQALTDGGNLSADGGSPRVRPILPSDVYLMQVYHGTASSAVTALTQLDTEYGLRFIDPNWHIDIQTTVGGTTNALQRVKIIGFPFGRVINGTLNTLGDIYGWAYVQFLSIAVDNDATNGDAYFRILQLGW